MTVNPSHQQHPIVTETVAALNQSQREHFEERAGILEYDANLERPLAEALALLEVIRLYGWPPRQK